MHLWSLQFNLWVFSVCLVQLHSKRVALIPNVTVDTFQLCDTMTLRSIMVSLKGNPSPNSLLARLFEASTDLRRGSFILNQTECLRNWILFGHTCRPYVYFPSCATLADYLYSRTSLEAQRCACMRLRPSQYNVTSLSIFWAPHNASSILLHCLSWLLGWFRH